MPRIPVDMSLRHSLWSNLAFGALAIVASACSSAPSDQGEPYTSKTETSSHASSPAERPALSANDIMVDLEHVPGVLEVVEQASPVPNARFFALRFEQPVDHRHPEVEKFSQRFTLLVRGTERPMVLSTPGYYIRPERFNEMEPTYYLEANQIHLEHRFFGASRPASMDWSKLDIFQAASDAHRVVQALRPLFPMKWLSTNGSKGGMTATYHRFFYPNDVFATIPYVAPISYGTSDPAYISFLDRVGDADCRAKLKAYQVEVLRRRDEIESRMLAEATADGDGYDLLGIHRALDYTVTDWLFQFWQSDGGKSCARVPGAAASTDELYAFLGFIYGPVYSGYGDQSFSLFAPYWYQAATELGGPGYDYSYTRDLLTPHFRAVPQALPPFGVDKPFHAASMPLVASWVRAHGERMLYIYGENDPWASRPYEVRRQNDSYRYFVPNGTHSASITQLPEAERSEALATLSRWMEVTLVPVDSAKMAARSTTPSESGALERRSQWLGQ